METFAHSDELARMLACDVSEPSQQAKDFVACLIYKEKTLGLSTEETDLLDRLMEVEHRMRIKNARARIAGAQ